MNFWIHLCIWFYSFADGLVTRSWYTLKISHCRYTLKPRLRRQISSVQNGCLKKSHTKITSIKFNTKRREKEKNGFLRDQHFSLHMFFTKSLDFQSKSLLFSPKKEQYLLLEGVYRKVIKKMCVKNGFIIP